MPVSRPLPLPHPQRGASEDSCSQGEYRNSQTLEQSWICTKDGCECTRTIKACFSDGEERLVTKTGHFEREEVSSDEAIESNKPFGSEESAESGGSDEAQEGVDWDCRYR